MKTVYALNLQIQELTQCLKQNTVELRQAHNNSVRLIELLHARTQIILSIVHRQGEVIKTYELALLSQQVNNVHILKKAS